MYQNLFLNAVTRLKQMCVKAVDTYPSTIEYIPDQFMIQGMCDKAIDKCPFVFESVPDQYRT